MTPVVKDMDDGGVEDGDRESMGTLNLPLNFAVNLKLLKKV
jgi:hypothetical protein